MSPRVNVPYIMIHAYKFTRIFPMLCRGFDQFFLKYKKITKSMKNFLIVLLYLIKWVNFIYNILLEGIMTKNFLVIQEERPRLDLLLGEVMRQAE
jgi:hypothetical protein